jgi:Holliday junction resolvase RusA-like endonuclease
MATMSLPPPPRGSADAAEVSVPPSTNNLFRDTGNRRFKTREYRDWLAEAIPTLATLRPPARFPVAIIVRVTGKLNVQRDLDNLLKPVGDALVDAGVLPADDVRHVTHWDVRYFRDERQPVVAIRIEEAA